MWTHDPNSHDFLAPSHSLSISLSITVFRWVFSSCHTGYINGLHAFQLGRDRHFRLTPDALTVAYFHQSRAHYDISVIP